MKQTLTRLLLLIASLSTATLFAYSQGAGSGGIGKKPQVKPVLSAEQIAKQYLPGVALIVCDDGNGNYSQGSGFFVAPGMILTNAHVVKGMVRGIVTTGKEQKKNPINAVAYFNFENTDLALLVSEETKKVKIPFLPLAQPNDLTIGETVYVLSNPKGLSGTISQGIVSSEIRKTKKMDLLQITAPISAGSSGGAVMNSRGEVIGIATSSLESGQNLNFAVPASRIGQFLDEFLTLPNPPEYVSLNKIAGSWIAPISFYSNSTNKSDSALNSFSNFSSEETTDWLIKNLEKTTVRSTLSKNWTVKRIYFSECAMIYEKEITSDKVVSRYDEPLTSAFLGNIKFMNSAKALNDEGDNIVLLTFSKDFPARSSLSGKNEKLSRNKEEIFVKNQDTAKLVASAFNHLAELCKQ